MKTEHGGTVGDVSAVAAAATTVDVTCHFVSFSIAFLISTFYDVIRVSSFHVNYAAVSNVLLAVSSLQFDVTLVCSLHHVVNAVCSFHDFMIA